MSKYLRRQGDLEVLYGWDDPLKYYFVVVEEVTGELPDAIIWSNLNLQKPGLSLGELCRIVEGFGVRLTLEERQKLLADALELASD